ncbi:hypothetical protein ncot_13415 [Nocardioides sp. JQ2195]|uniref:MXAN_6640 family putative metalloprotease n=1 Tax=Nocardioides sp. JQ2195 TaxID=2592334 RepID=UPI00143E779C|nr:MXAN_6640 family putative metalloprotease [Nocardioides sp. JQ2195]QIX27496.1 hypothetical protein ncot_13415 [Nocardioides sp. JQ2195]
MATLGALVLPVGLAAPAGAASTASASAAPVIMPDDDRGQHAKQALDQAEATLDGGGSLDATLALVEVQQTKHDLSGTDRERAASLLARPTDDDNRPTEISYDGEPSESHCTEHFCIHWVTEGKHAPASDDADHDGLPDYVETVATAMERVWATEVDTLGYRSPISDGTKGNPDGESRKGLVDVYLGNTGAQQVYGYAVPEDTTSTSSAYLVLDNDFAEFSGRPIDALKVTAAHEFFHAVQFAYSTMGDRWFMESTAAWVEERVYDDIDDNRQFLAGSTAVRPGKPLDRAANLYANWVFFEALSQRHGPRVVRAAWHQVAVGRNSMTAVNTALTKRGSSLATEFSRFASGSNVPRLFFEEGSNYARSAVTRAFRLGPTRHSTGTHSFRQDHMSSRNYVFRPRRGTRDGTRLRIRLATESHRVRARLLVKFTDGAVKRRTIDFGDAGVARAGVAFSRSSVSRVVLTLSNTSFRYRCFEGTALTCQGIARDDDTLFTYRATVRRR